MQRGMILFVLLALAACVPQPTVPELKNVDALASVGLTVSNQTISYYPGYTGFYAAPDAQGTYPGVIMIHEWWGLNDNIKEMAIVLAAQGYHVLAVDLHGKVATTPDEARALTSALDQTKAIANMKAAKAFLKEKGATKMASLGWCFGGGQSLQLALNEQLDTTVIYYGRLVTNASQLSPIAGPVLGIFGEKDTGISVQSVNDFDAALTQLGKEHEIHIYPGVGHAFANPSGANYAPNETKDAWDKTLAFLEKHLKE